MEWFRSNRPVFEDRCRDRIGQYRTYSASQPARAVDGVEALTAEQRDDVGSDLHADRPPGQPACDHVDLETGNLAGGRIVESVQHHGFVEAVEELRIEEALDGAPDNFLVVRRVSAAQPPHRVRRRAASSTDPRFDVRNT